MYFDDVIKNEDFYIDKVSLDEKSYKNLLTYEVLYKTLISVKALSVVFDKVYRFITDYDGNKYLVLFRTEKHNVIFDRIGYVIGMKSGATYVFSHNYTKSKFIQMMI